MKDISQKYESRSQPENPVSRTPSFGKKKEEISVKQDEKEGDETVKVWFIVGSLLLDDVLIYIFGL